MGFACTVLANQHQVFTARDIFAVYIFPESHGVKTWPFIQVCRLQHFQCRKLRILQPPFQPIGLSLFQFLRRQVQQKALVTLLCFARLTGTFRILAQHDRKSQKLKMVIQNYLFTGSVHDAPPVRRASYRFTSLAATDRSVMPGIKSGSRGITFCEGVF